MIKYKGKITDLKPYGFTFHKLYANDYKAYMHEDCDMLIWVAGRDIRFKNLNSKDFETVFNMIINDEYPLYEKTQYWLDKDGKSTGKVFFAKGAPKLCLVDKETGEIISHHDFMLKYKKVYPEYNDYMDFFHSGRFSELILHKRHIDFIKDMHVKGMLG